MPINMPKATNTDLVYTKEQLANYVKFSPVERDMLGFLLEADKTYTEKDAVSIIAKYRAQLI